MLSKSPQFRCSFCGKSQEQVRKLIAGPEVYICDECIGLCNDIILEELEDESSLELKNVLKPREIVDILDQYVVGQDRAKKIVSVSVYNHYKRIALAKNRKDDIEVQKSNILFIGPTGSGKTYIAQTLAKVLNVPFCIADATTLTEAGYVGEDVESILLNLLRSADYDVAKAEKGIVYIDEIDKIVGKNGGSGPDVSREGVQRDLLPLVEGSVVATKYGPVKTDHVLFIASGAFHSVKPSDLIPELQGRFPIRVELEALGQKEFVRILTEPKNALLTQYLAMLKTEGVNISFEPGAIEEIARIAEEVNSHTENIGARRLHTIMERLLEDILFDAPDMNGSNVVIDEKAVLNKLKDIKDNEDLSRYIL